MTTLNATLMIAAMMALLNASPIQATPGADPADKSIVRTDKVGADMNTPADRNTAIVYDRQVILNNGMYDVLVTDVKGTLRMKGTYADEELTTPEGEFTFYYSNGNIESQGMYANGLKTGTWHRFDIDGSPKAERNYIGMTWEDMAVSLGMASKAGSY